MDRTLQKVLICPLDWGLGHASRMIPVTQCYLAQGYEVILGGSGKSGELFRKSFPALPYIALPSPVIRYATKGRYLWLSLLSQIPGMVVSAIGENRLLKKIVSEQAVKIVVSDNRYGLFCRHAHSIIVTHQISPALPFHLRWAEYLVYLVIRTMVLQFDECWIPDYPDPEINLSGRLSHRYRLPRNAVFIGPLSRFKLLDTRQNWNPQEIYELVILLSGPEPQLSIWFRKMLALSLKISYKTLIITGFNNDYHTVDISGYPTLTIVPHLDPQTLGPVLKQAKGIVCRSGYSGIMDLVALEKEALLVPTPGQSEQEYLAEYLHKKYYFSCISQDELDEEILQRYMQGTGFSRSVPAFPEGNDLPVQPASD